VARRTTDFGETRLVEGCRRCCCEISHVIWPERGRLPSEKCSGGLRVSGVAQNKTRKRRRKEKGIEEKKKRKTKDKNERKKRGKNSCEETQNTPCLGEWTAQSRASRDWRLSVDTIPTHLLRTANSVLLIALGSTFLRYPNDG
jgi:hypothetical protein